MGFVVALVAVFFVGFAATPAAAQSDNIDLCEDAEDTATTIQDIFFIMQVLGPIFGTLFYVGMAVADSATLKPKYEEKRRKVLLLGFGVPVAIVFLEAIADNALLSDTDIGCFFPGGDD